MALSAFDSDVLIYAAESGHPLDEKELPDLRPGAVASVLLLPDVLARPMRADAESDETRRLLGILRRIELVPLEEPMGRLALARAVTYGVRGADAVHLATAVAAGADRFVTNNSKDFAKSIDEIEIVYLHELEEPGG